MGNVLSSENGRYEHTHVSPENMQAHQTFDCDRNIIIADQQQICRGQEFLTKPG